MGKYFEQCDRAHGQKAGNRGADKTMHDRKSGISGSVRPRLRSRFFGERFGTCGSGILQWRCKPPRQEASGTWACDSKKIFGRAGRNVEIRQSRGSGGRSGVLGKNLWGVKSVRLSPKKLLLSQFSYGTICSEHLQMNSGRWVFYVSFNEKRFDPGSDETGE